MERETARSLLVRTLISVPLAVLGMHLVGTFQLQFMLMGMSLVVLVGVIMSEPVSTLLSASAGSIYAPGRKREGPGMMLSQVEALVMRGRGEEALRMLIEISESHPRSVEPYLMRMDIALRVVQDADAARKALHDGLDRVRGQRERELLASEYARLRSVHGHAEDAGELERSGGAGEA